MNRFFLMSYAKDYLLQLDELDKKIGSDLISLPVASRKVSKLTNNLIDVACKVEKKIRNKRKLKEIKKEFRKIIFDNVIKKSILMKRALEKPRGYPGDYNIIESIYNRKALSRSVGYCFDQYLLKDSYAFAIRARKEKMKIMLFDFIKRSKLDSINILNLACGSCREIRELFSESSSKFGKNINFTLVDQDEEALGFSKKEIEKMKIANISFKFIRRDVLGLFTDEDNILLKKQDLIYSIGLMDYLPDVVLRPLLRYMYNQLEYNGRLIIAHKDVKKYKPAPSDWLCDWGNFYIRDEAYLVKLLKTLFGRGVDINIERDSSDIIFFLAVEKK